MKTMKAIIAVLACLAVATALGSCTCRDPERTGAAGSRVEASGDGAGALSGETGSGARGASGGGASADGADGRIGSPEGGDPSRSGDALATPQTANLPQKSAVKAPAPPVFETGPGPFAEDILVSLRSEAGTSLRYSLDGSVPGQKGGTAYSEPIALKASATVTAVAFRQGAASKPAVRTFTLREVCVSPKGKGPGTRDAPSGSIAQALATAESLGIGEVKLASGEYDESVEVRSTVSLSGGWATGFAKRGGTGTIVVGSTGGTKDAPRTAIAVIGSRGSLSLSRMELRGGQADYNAGILVKDGAQAYLSDCMVSGGSGSYSYAARVTGKSTVSIDSCRLNGGDAENSVALSLDSSSARLVRSRALAGSGTVLAYGVQCTASSLTAASSIIAGGNANQSYGAGIYSCKDVSILGCTVYGGGGVNCYAVFSSQSSPSVKGCLLGSRGSAKSFAVYENFGDSSLASLQANAFWGSASGIYYDIDTKTAFSGINATGAPADADKALSTPKATSNALWTGSPAADLSTPKDPLLASSGMALDEIAATDLAGKKRSAPWSVGAFELD